MSDEIQALEKQLSELEAKRAARRKISPADQKLALERKLKDEQARDDAEEKYGVANIAVFEAGGRLVIVRTPESMRYRKYLAIWTKLGDSKKEADNVRLVDEATNLCLSCLVHPTREEFDELAEKFGGMPVIVAGLCSDLAAGRTQETAEK